MIFDSHLHLFSHGYNGFPGTSPLGSRSDIEAYEALMAAYGIDGGLVVCYEAEGIDPTNNAFVRELATTHSWIASVAYLDAAVAPPAHIVAGLLDAGHIGIAVYLPDEAAALALAGWPRVTWRLLSDRRAIVSLNARPAAIRKLDATVAAAQGCQFLFSHLGLPGRQEKRVGQAEATRILEPLLRVAGAGNVGVKISGLYAIDPVAPHVAARPFVDALLEWVPPADLHWGSDFSPALGFVSFEDTLNLPALSELPEAARREIMGQGLARKVRRASGN
jgi:predicted TIM-barrel fold metal-dependent hydrolase